MQRDLGKVLRGWCALLASSDMPYKLLVFLPSFWGGWNPLQAHNLRVLFTFSPLCHHREGGLGLLFCITAVRMNRADNFPLFPAEQQVSWDCLDLHARTWDRVPEWLSWCSWHLLMSSSSMAIIADSSHTSWTQFWDWLWDLSAFWPWELYLLSLLALSPPTPFKFKPDAAVRDQRWRVTFLARMTRQHVQDLHSVESKATGKNGVIVKKERDRLTMTFLLPLLE